MSQGRPKTSHLFLAAVCGGLVVAFATFLIYSAGLIPSERGSGGGPVATIAPVRSADDDNRVNEIYRSSGDGVAFIYAEVAESGSPGSPFGGGGEASGSGFVVDREGLIVTNDHVVEGANAITVKLGEETYDATLVGSDPSTDLALLKVDAPRDVLNPLPLGDSDDVEVGDPVVAIGNPFGLERTVTTGIVSALQRNITSVDNYSISEVIQTDAAINPGNSGGPLINDAGEVIGVNSQIATGGGSGGNVGIGFAVPSNTVSEVVDQLIDTGEVRHAWLGISGADVDPAVAAELGPGDDVRGVLVESVIPDGPADRAGIEGGRTGDVIVSIGDLDGPTMNEVTALVNDLEPGDSVPVTVLRDGSEAQLELVLGERP